MSLARFLLGHGSQYNVMTQALARGQSKASAVLEEEATRAKRAISLKGLDAFHPALMTPPADSLRAHLAEHRLPHPTIFVGLESRDCTRCDWRRSKRHAHHAANLSHSMERLGLDHDGCASRSLYGNWTTKVLSGLNRRKSEGILRIARREPDDFDGLEA
jgi:hypothetical protein